MRKQVGGRWLTHQVVRSEPATGPLHYEHIIPVLIFALRYEIHREQFSTEDVVACIVTATEHGRLRKLRNAPDILIPALACERDQVLDVCLRRYSDIGVEFVALPTRILARQHASAESLEA